MVGNGFSRPKLLAYLGLARVVGSTFMVSPNAGSGQEEKAVTESSKAAAATENSASAPAAAADAKPDAKAPTKPEALPDVTFSQGATASKEDEAQLEPVRAAIKSFAQTFNAHDAKAVAALFTVQGEIINQAGQITRGREAIQENFGKLFTAFPQVTIRFEVESMRFLSPELAVEEGYSIMAHTTENGMAPPQHDRYTVTHVKVQDQWLVASARDWAPPPPNGPEQLAQLEWLVGEWVDENGDTLVHTHYHWSADKHYLLSEYSVQHPGRPAVQGTQRIGWDPRFQKLHSWTFDTAGGFTEGLWSHSGNQWIVKITGVAADGRTRSATNILTRLSKDHATFQSRDRVVGGEVMADMAEVPIVRKPPQPTPRAKKAE